MSINSITRAWIILLFILLFDNIKSQQVSSWYYGTYAYIIIDSNQLDTGYYYYSGMNIMKFNPVMVTRKFKSLSLNYIVSNMWNKNGDIQYFYNGSKVFNFEHKLIEGADSLNFSKVLWNKIDSGYYADQSRYRGYYPNAVNISHPTNENQYYLIYTKTNYDSSLLLSYLSYNQLVYCLIDMSLNNGKGKMIVKEKPLFYSNLSPVLAATKHANGKDWWIIARAYQDTNCFYFLKIDNQGIRFDHKQCIGWNTVFNDYSTRDLMYGLNFSQDGKQLAKYSRKGVELFGFDRCAGTLSNPRQAAYPLANEKYDSFNSFYPYQIGFSPSGQYLYALNEGVVMGANKAKVFQLDTKASDFSASAIKVAEYDGFRDTFGSDPNQAGWQTTFFTLQLAPDNKIYIGTGLQTRYLHVIEEPDKKGLDCNLRQHAIKLLTIKAAIPMYPNYALGADSSSCQSAISESHKESIQLYPNPAMNYIEIQSDNINLSIEIYNITGQQIINTKPENKKIDISKLKEGIYFIKILNKYNSLMYFDKLIISH